MVHAPTTPARQSASSANPNSLRTPSNLGSAAVSDQLNSFLVKEVGPWIAQDIKSNIHCGFERLIQVLLLRATKGNINNLPDATKDDVNNLPDLEPYLNAVLPLCNRLVPEVKAYCTAARNEKETAMYPPLVSLLNKAMDGLKRVDLGGLLGDDEELLFHVSDPKVIKTVHRGGIVSERKPDIMLLSSEAARNAGNLNAMSDHWSDIAFKNALKPPMEAFTWEGSRVPIEVKPGSVPSKPPMSYIVKKTITTKPARKVKMFQDKATPVTSQRAKVASHQDTAIPTTSQQATVASHQKSTTLAPDSAVVSSQRKTRSATKEQPAIVSRNVPDSAPTKRTAAPNQTIQHQDKLDVTVQCALYGAEVLSASPSLASAMSLAIIGNIVHVWWYDRQGAIQTKGLDFVEDLPYFVVLLLALQRLGPVGYGELPFKKGKKIVIPSGPVEVTMGKAIMQHYGIVGRATNVYHATSSSPDPRQANGEDAEPSVDQLSISIDGIRNLTLDGKDRQSRPLGDVANSLEGLEMIAKISWVQEHRTAEHTIVNNAVKKAKELPDEDDDRIAIIGHVPEIIATIEYEGYDTNLIRGQLGFGTDHTAVERNRRCRVIISRYLRPITELEGDDLLAAFLQCVLCHRALWQLGFHHRDISERNLMYFKEGDEIFGVLNDFDLATMVGAKHATNSERTGTLPFMALDLLTRKGCNGEVEHLYRHDLESFLWVLVWITFRFQDGKLVEDPPFWEWTQSPEACFTAKAAFLYKNTEIVELLLERRLNQLWERFNLPWCNKFADADLLRSRRPKSSPPEADSIMPAYINLIPDGYANWKPKKYVPFRRRPRPPVSAA